VRVLTPVGYDREPRRRWPVLWLLHGTSETPPGTEATGYASWTDKGNAEVITRPGRFLVIMPEASAGLYTDHYGVAGEGGPGWESYHIRQLLPWVDKHYRTQPTRAARAVAGLSMGGGGSMSYAARHPDLFSLAESYSGAVDPTDAGQELGAVPVRATDINQALQPVDGRPPESAFGPWATEEVRTRAHTAVDMVGNLRHTVLTLRTGDGTNEQGVITDPLEFGVHGQGVNLHRALDRAGISHTWDDYGSGGHTWDKFSRGLALLVHPLNAHFASGAGRAPSSFSFTTAEERADVYGFHAVSDRGFMEFATFDVAPGRVAVSGSGAFTVTTARRYVAGARYTLTASRNGTTQQLVVLADRLGRLSFALDTGCRSAGQQYRRTSGTTRVNQVQVSIRRAQA
jgi:S-formylglutathione hydrolase FrmB